MRWHQRLTGLFSLALALAVAPSAHAQALDGVKPTVVIAVDLSGSMDLRLDGELYGYADFPAQKTRWMHVIEILTGTYLMPAVEYVSRVTPGIGPLWAEYPIPHFRLKSTFGQMTNGILDQYGSTVRFSLATTEGERCTGTGPDCGCSYGNTYGGINMGMRGPECWQPLSGIKLAGFIPPPANDTTTALQANSSIIQSALLSSIPIGSSPITAFLDDILFAFKNEPTMKEPDGVDGDPYFACRSKHVVLLTDGVETTTSVPGKTAVEVISELYAMGVRVHVVGFALQNLAEKDYSQLTEMAIAGGGTDFYDATDVTKLKEALSKVMVDVVSSMRVLAPVVTSRTGNLTDLQLECYGGDRKNTINDAFRAGFLQCVAYRCTDACKQPDGSADACVTYDLVDAHRERVFTTNYVPKTFTPAEGHGVIGRPYGSYQSGTDLPTLDGNISVNTMTMLKETQEFKETTFTNATVNETLAVLHPCKNITDLNTVVTTNVVDDKSLSNTQDSDPGVPIGTDDGTNSDPATFRNNSIDGTTTDSTTLTCGGVPCPTDDPSKPLEPPYDTADTTTVDAGAITWTKSTPASGTLYADWANCALAKLAIWKHLIGHQNSTVWPDVVPGNSDVQLWEGVGDRDVNNASFALFKELYKNGPTWLIAATQAGSLMFYKMSRSNITTEKIGTVEFQYVPGCVQSELKDLFAEKIGGKFRIRTVRFKTEESQIISDIEGTAASWHTVLIGCTGTSARCCFGLDITKLQSANEADRQFEVLWEAQPGRRCYKGSDNNHTCVTTNIDYLTEGVDAVARKFGEYGAITVRPEIGNVHMGRDKKSIVQAVVVIPGGAALTRQVGTEFVRLGGRAIYVQSVEDGSIIKVFTEFTDITRKVPEIKRFRGDVTGEAQGYNVFLATNMTRAFMGDNKGRMFRLGISGVDRTKLVNAAYDSVANWRVKLVHDAFWDADTPTWQFGLDDARRRPVFSAPALAVQTRGELTVIYGTGVSLDVGYNPYQNTVQSFNEMLVPDVDGNIDLKIKTNWRLALKNGERLVGTPVIFGGVAYFTSYLPLAGAAACQVGDGRLYGLDYILTDSVDGLPLGKLTNADTGTNNRYATLVGVPTAVTVVQRPTCFADAEIEDVNGTQQLKTGTANLNSTTTKTEILVGTRYAGTNVEQMKQGTTNLTAQRTLQTANKPKTFVFQQSGWSLILQ